MKVLSAAQIKEADQFTIQNQNISSVELMERAASACTKLLVEKFNNQKDFTIICGPGNNGGDGLAIARQLWFFQKNVTVYFCNINNQFSNDFLINKSRLENETKIKLIELKEENQHFLLNDGDLIIDCIFGNGLNKPITGWLGNLIHAINNNNCTKVSIDLPSGLYSDNTLNIDGTETIVKSDFTLTFQQPKLSLLLPEGIYYSGQVLIIDIGIDKQYLQNASTDFFLITKDIAHSLIKPRPISGHKGTFGHAYIIAGSEGKGGAAALTAKAALRSGCGLVTIETAGKNCNTVLNFVPEAMVQSEENSQFPNTVNYPDKTTSIGFGPGIGNTKETNKLLKLLLNKWNGSLVIDADGLNIIADDKTLLPFLPPGCILTPHPGEFDRLFNLKKPLGYERLNVQIEMSKKYNVFIVLKGFRTSISTPKGRVYFNSTGNNGMATAGSGDVLTGIITSLLAQGYYPLEASILGVYLHGLAGDLALNEQTEESLIASDLINGLGKAFKGLK